MMSRLCCFTLLSFVSAIVIAQDNAAPNTDTFVEELDTRFGTLQLHRITINGTALDNDDRPIENATIILGLTSLNGSTGKGKNGKEYNFDHQLGECKTDRAGRFRFEKLLVPAHKPPDNFPGQEPLHVPLQLIGIADGFGMTWCKSFQFRPSPKQKIRKDEENALFAGEPIEIELRFPDEVPLHGQLTDRNNKPIANATVHLGLYRSGMSGPNAQPKTWIMSLPDVGGVQPRIIPSAARVTTTDDNGKYEFNNVPAGARLGYSFSHPDLPTSLSGSISTGEQGRTRVGHDGVFNRQAARTRTVRVRAIDPSSGEAVPGAMFELANAPNLPYQQAASGIANEDGIATLKVVPGTFSLWVLPPSNVVAWRRRHMLVVEEEPPKESMDFELAPAGKLLLSTNRDETGVSGLGFEYTTNREDWAPLPTQGGVTEYSTTSSDGTLVAVLPAGAAAIRVSRENVVDDSAINFTIEPGKSHVLAVEVPKGAVIKGVRSNLRGKFCYRRNNFIKGELTIDEFVKTMNTIKETDPAEIFEKLQAYLGPFNTSKTALTQDQDKRRVEVSYGDHGPSSQMVNVSDGVHHIRFGAANRQCDVETLENSHIHLDSIDEIFDRQYDIPEAQVTKDGDRTIHAISKDGSTFRQIVDTDTGFVRHTERTSSHWGRLAWQFVPQEVAGKTFPTIVVKARFREEKLERAEVTYFDSIELMESVPPETFAVYVPAGTNVVDRRGDNPNQIGRSGRSNVLRSPTHDVVARIGQPIKQKRGLSYGNPAPKMQVTQWAKKGRLIDPPDLSDKMLIVCMLPKDYESEKRQFPSIRRMIEKLSDKSDVEVIALMGRDVTPVQMAKFSVVRQLDCLLAIDAPIDGDTRQGKTRAAFGERSSHSVTVIIDREGKIRFYASHNDHINSALRYAERILKYKKQ